MITMNSRFANRTPGLEAARSLPPRTDDSGETPLNGEDLVADLDPGWLDWREEQAGR